MRLALKVFLGTAVLGGLGHTVLTTPRGVMTGARARKLHVGGEILLEIW